MCIRDRTSFWSLSALLTVAVETPHFSAIVFNDTIVSSTLSKHHLIVFVLLLYAIFCKNAIHICHFGEFNTFFADFLCIFACSISFSSIISCIFPVILIRFRFLSLYFGFQLLCVFLLYFTRFFVQSAVFTVFIRISIDFFIFTGYTFS